MADSPDDLEKADGDMNKDEQVTVKDMFEDDDDDDEDADILEYVDMVDEGYYTPSNIQLVLLLLLVLLASAGVGVLIYYAVEDRNEEEQKSTPISAPTLAPPTVSTESPSGGFLCNICALGDVTIPDGVVDIVGQPKCSDLESRGKAGTITEGQCGLLQAITAEPCGCDQVTPKPCTVCAIGVVRNPDGVIDVSSAGFAGIESLTCGQLDTFAQAGQIPPEFCPLVQETSVDICDCGEAPSTPEFCTVCSSGVVRNLEGVLNVTAAGFPGIDTVTCGALVTFEEAGSIPMEFCAELHEASFEVCDCGPEFVCPICGANGTIGSPDGIIDFAGQSLTCADLEGIAASGQIVEAQCPGVQTLASTPCNCGVADDSQATLDLLASVVGDQVYVAGTSEYLAAQFLLYEDPRFVQARRRLEPLSLFQDQSTEESSSSSNGTTVPDAPPSEQDPQSNSTDEVLPIAASNPDTSTNTTDEAIPFDSNVTITNDQEDSPGNNETTGSTTEESSIVTLSDLEDNAIIQRYLLILLYFQTTENRASPWSTNCAAATDTATSRETRRRLQSSSECTFGDNEQASKWLSEALECEWAGVTCSATTGEVLQIQLVEFGLRGSLPTQLLELPSLVGINLSSNNLTGSIPSAYFSSNISNLENLNLANNTFQGSLPLIENGDTLRALNVSYNILDSGVQIVTSAAVLRLLDVSNNNLTGDLSSVGLASTLVTLDVTNNKFQGNLSEVAELFDLEQLTSLQLSRNSFSGTIPNAISSLTNIEILELYENNLRGSIPTEISSLTALKRLDLSDNALEGGLPTEMRLLTSLQTLLLFNNLLTGAIPSELGYLTSLQTANLNTNEFIGEVPAEVCNLMAQYTMSIFGVDCDEVMCECCVCCTNKQCDNDAMVL